MEKEFGRIPKTEKSDIVIRVDDFNDSRGVTIREFVNSERYTGFTKSGVRIMASDFESFKNIINSITEKDLNEEE